jgi:hypothetical protein
MLTSMLRVMKRTGLLRSMSGPAKRGCAPLLFSLEAMLVCSKHLYIVTLAIIVAFFYLACTNFTYEYLCHFRHLGC